jgi:uncharacterized protein YdaU (DUF1376 family)
LLFGEVKGMNNPWSAFYWGDYLAPTSHLTLAQHGAYLLLMAHYYTTRSPLPASAPLLRRVCRCMTDAEQAAVAKVLQEFFIRRGDVYRHERIDRELAKASEISQKRREAAKQSHRRPRALAPATALGGADAPHLPMHLQTQPQPQSQEKKSKVFMLPTLEEVTQYCRERGNLVDPQQWFDYYTANGWRVGRNPMRDWKAAIRTWERTATKRRPMTCTSIGTTTNGEVSLVNPVADFDNKLAYRLPEDLDEQRGKEIWEAADPQITARVSRHSYDTWFRPLKPAGISAQTLFVKIPSEGFKFLAEKYADLLAEIFPELKIELVAPDKPATLRH